MEVMNDFTLLRPESVADAMRCRRENPNADFLAGGTDLLVNRRRGIGDADTLIDLTAVGEIAEITITDNGLTVGAGVRLADLVRHDIICRDYPILAQAAKAIAGPTHQRFATVGGNICLDTRCIYYNQSQWWRQSNDFCLKYKGEICHVAPKSKICFAAFSGDLAPAMLVLGAEVELAGLDGTRRIPLQDLYTDDGAVHLTLGDGEFVVALHVPPPQAWNTFYKKVRVRESIEFPLAGVAVALGRDGDRLSHLGLAFTGTNPRPILVDGLEELVGETLSEDVQERILRLANKQIRPMKSTFSPSTYRRSVATKLALHVIRELWDGKSSFDRDE
jgi:4-hydroxybenzoyl-CoA reductase subunit beta